MSIDINLKNLQLLLSTLDANNLTKDDFATSFENVVNFIKKIEEKNIKEFEMLNNLFNRLGEDLKTKTELNVSDLNQNCMDYCMTEMEKMLKAHEVKMQEADDKMDMIQDGKDADEERMVNDIIGKIQEPIVSKVGENLPQLGTAVRDGLEILQGDDRLDVSAIKGLEPLLEDFKKSNSIVGGGFSSIAMNMRFVDLYVPSGAINGVNTDFVATHIPNPDSSLEVFKGGTLQSLTDDYTLSSKTITFLSAPVAGEIIKIKHRI